MQVAIRPESANHPQLMNMLKYQTNIMLRKLHDNGINLPDKAVKIWIKEFGNEKYFPKIEFDHNNQELQYDLTHEGEIREAHFKSFVRNGNKTQRRDLDRNDADALLVRIDTLLRYDPQGCVE